MDDNSTPIQKFYHQKDVFITGATGFLGRLLLEKLLRSCSIHNVYVLVRAKKGKSHQQRLNELFACIIFDRLKKEKPDFQDCIIPITGDCAEIGLGLSSLDRENLIKNVQIVFHCAATVNFNETLHLATTINIRGVRELIYLARQMKNLVFYTHVSTAYAHCPQQNLSERFYPSIYTPHQMITLVEQLPKDIIDGWGAWIVGEYPNTYTFTKSIAEQLIAELRDFPAAVFRPAVMVSTLREPIPGWINNYYGPQGVTVAAMVGLLRSLHCDGDVEANIVPVDMCVNALLALPWDARHQDVSTPLVYHFESNTTNPIRWRRFHQLVHDCGIHLRTVKCVGVYFFHLRRNYYCHHFATLLLHYLPALLLDGALIIARKQPRLLEGYRKLHMYALLIAYFCTRSWTFDSHHVTAMCDRMSDSDRELFACDLRLLDWTTFFKTYLLGCRLYLLKDPIETLPRAVRLYKRITLITSIILVLGAGALLFVLITAASILQA